MPAIEVSHLTKEYRLGSLQSLKQTIHNAGMRLLGRPVYKPPRFKALDNVSFTVERGEVLGIIGHNGAGKSTLLKMLAGISTPTSGSVTVHGLIAPLIEVGAGFIGDFTGRENVYLNGSILGMSRKEIKRKFDEIVDFSEMADFIDTPIKRYSSGMQIKLAFAVATSVESEILIVDEVLAVGDLAFQRKCFDRMEDLIKRQQRTVLLVSHNIRQVERLCSRVIVLDHGKVSTDDLPQAACNAFYVMSDKQIAENVKKAEGSKPWPSTRHDDLSLVEATLLDRDRNAVDKVTYSEPCTLRLTFFTPHQLEDINVGIGVHTPDLLYVSVDDSIFSPMGPQTFEAGRFTMEYQLEKFLILPGSYSFRIGVAHAKTDQGLFYAENICHFQVLPGQLSLTRLVGQGFFMLNGQWTVTERAPTTAAGILNIAPKTSSSLIGR